MKLSNNQKDSDQLISMLNGKSQFYMPKKLNLLGTEYKIILKDKLDVRGRISFTNKTIELKRRDGIGKTLVHEVIHARDNFFGYKKSWNTESTEAAVIAESEFWTQFFRQVFPLAKLGKSVLSDPESSEKDDIVKTLEAKVKRQAKQISTLRTKLKMGVQNE